MWRVSQLCYSSGDTIPNSEKLSMVCPELCRLAFKMQLTGGTPNI